MWWLIIIVAWPYYLLFCSVTSMSNLLLSNTTSSNTTSLNSRVPVPGHAGFPHPEYWLHYDNINTINSNNHNIHIHYYYSHYHMYVCMYTYIYIYIPICVYIYIYTSIYRDGRSARRKLCVVPRLGTAPSRLKIYVWHWRGRSEPRLRAFRMGHMMLKTVTKDK